MIRLRMILVPLLRELCSALRLCCPAPRCFVPLLTLVLLLFFGGCAKSPMDRLMPQVETVASARQHFGPPASSTELPDGTVRHEWVLDQSTQEPGRYVTQRSYWGHDRDGFRKSHERTVWVPAHRVGQYCRLWMISDANGRVLRSDWEGNACEAMMVGRPQ